MQAGGEDVWEGRFLAGFIALRWLGQADVAAQRFAETAMLSKDAYGKATAGFWLGRALTALGRTEDGHKAWKAAAQWPHTFYGQVASARLGTKPTIATDAKAIFGAMDVAEVLATPDGKRIAAAQAAGDLRTRNDALKRLAGGSTKEMGIACTMAVRTGAVDIAVEIARNAAKRGIALVECGWPQVKFAWHDARAPRELVLAVSREESTFNQGSTSSANARGAMQVLDGTAVAVGKSAGVPINLGMMRASADYNVAVGSYYLGDLLKKYNFYSVLAIAAYNAGPGRVDEWIQKIGDPRGGQIDVVDWIESIPFAETRAYVKRVYSSMCVYLAQGQQASAK
ncbi:MULTISPECIES: lytic transglycosylase domain-containing protein [unclassified Bradyrhizobium]